MTMDARLARQIKGVINDGSSADSDMVIRILQLCDEAEEAALHPSVGAWGFHEGKPLHLPSFYEGQRHEANDALDRWLQINRDMVTRGFVQNWLRERSRARAS